MRAMDYGLVAAEVTRRMVWDSTRFRLLTSAATRGFLIRHDLQTERCGRNRCAVETLNFRRSQSAIVEPEIIHQTVDGFGDGAVTTDAQGLAGLQHGAGECCAGFLNAVHINPKR